jgi:tryptophan synthase beta chain
MKMLGAEVRPALSGSKTLKDATNEEFATGLIIQ